MKNLEKKKQLIEHINENIKIIKNNNNQVATDELSSLLFLHKNALKREEQVTTSGLDYDPETDEFTGTTISNFEDTKSYQVLLQLKNVTDAINENNIKKFTEAAAEMIGIIDQASDDYGNNGYIGDLWQRSGRATTSIKSTVGLGALTGVIAGGCAAGFAILAGVAVSAPVLPVIVLGGLIAGAALGIGKAAINKLSEHCAKNTDTPPLANSKEFAKEKTKGYLGNIKISFFNKNATQTKTSTDTEKTNDHDNNALNNVSPTHCAAT